MGKNVSVGHNAILHGCTIGEGALVGMGAIVMNGAKIGKESVVGAGALVPEGKEFPERSLIVGSPARVVRTLNDEQVKLLTRAAPHYVKNSARFKAGLKKIG
jgi:carbonic anhydrase/acetyltransferase-like protein (isoleucine patch superfamily)